MSNLDGQAVEQKVRQIWREVLEMKEGQEAATFFDLKGDSISAVRLVARVEDELGVSVDVGDIFEEDPDLPTFLRDVLAAHEDKAA
jgi:peptidyl carrier protein